MNKKLLPLYLLDNIEGGEIDGITRFQKLIFLIQEEGTQNDLYPFRAGSYGPYSKPLYDDIDRLVEQGFLSRTEEPSAPSHEKDKQVYEITDKGRRTLQKATDELAELQPNQIDDIISEYQHMGLWNLLEYVYSEYPAMAENSKLDIS